MKKRKKTLISGVLCTAMLCEMWGGVDTLAARAPENVKQVLNLGIDEKSSEQEYKGTNVKGQDYKVWSKPMYSYLSACEDGTLMRVRYVEALKECHVEYYDDSYTLIKSQVIPQELPIFGGFYATDENYYLLTGQGNQVPQSEIEAFRVTKYDKNWNRIGATLFKGFYNAKSLPFEAGCPRMDFDGKYLLIRTSQQVGHQWNVTLQVDTESMEVTDFFTGVGSGSGGDGYVSHSFNQFIKVENDRVVSIDHGDMYPRGVVLCKYNTDVSTGEFYKHDGVTCKKVVEYPLIDKGNSNITGVSVGGFELSDSSYLIPYNQILGEEDRDTRNIFLASVDKDSLEVTANQLTSYAEGEETASTPQMVKISDNRFLILWQAGDTVYYTESDGAGKTSDIYCMGKQAALSDCAPIVKDNKVMWYTWTKRQPSSERTDTFYEIDLQNIGKAKATVLTGDATEVTGFCADGKHSTKYVKQIEPDCLNEGRIAVYECEHCGALCKDKEGTEQYSKEELVIPAKGHDNEVELKDGIAHFKCKVCGEESEKKVATYVEVLVFEDNHWIHEFPTNLKIGDTAECLIDLSPSDNEDELEVEIDDVGKMSWEKTSVFLNRNYGTLIAKKPGTVTVTFRSKYNPSVKEVREIEIACEKHEMQYVPEKAATCSEVGTAAHWKCTVCEQMFADEAGKEKLESVEIPALGHQYGKPTFQWTKDNTCTADFKCGTCGKNQSVKCDITIDTKDAVCEEGGTVTYKAVCTFEGKEYTDTKTEKVPALGHKYGKPTFQWAEDNTCTAVYTCENCKGEKKTACQVTEKTTEATCEKAGKTVYTAVTALDGDEYTDKKTVEIPALGHQYGKPTFQWTKDNTCTADFKCGTCGKNQSVKCDITMDTKDAVCEEGGTVTYKAVCTFEGKEYTDTKTEKVPALGHKYGKPTFQWAEDNTCTAVYTCENCKGEKKTACQVTKKTTEATCEKAGKTVYTAVTALDGVEDTDKKTVELPALGHQYGKPTFQWTKDNTCIADFKCGTCGKNQSVKCDITIDTKDAVCEEGGTVTYKAVCTFEGKEYTDSKTEKVPALGHKYGKPTFQWAEDNTCTAVYTCENCKGEKKTACQVTKKTTEATCEKAGKTVYTAVTELEGVEYTDKKTVEIPALGHKYGKPNFQWTKDNTCTASYSCETCKETKKDVCTVTSETTEPTCDEKGKTVYKAVCVVNGKEYTDTKTIEIPATGHQYGKPVFSWTKENTCSAVYVCENCKDIREESCKVTKKTTEATCEKAGKTVYTAVTELEGVEYTDKKTVEIPALGHQYSKPTFQWAEDNTCTADFKCGTCGKNQSVKCDITIDTKDAVCEEGGTVTYKAVCTFEGKEYTDTKTVEVPALGHQYGKPVFQWAEDNTCAIVVACHVCGETGFTDNCEVVSTKTEPTCEEAGAVVYTTAYTYEGVEYTDKKTVEIPALGHQYGRPTFQWTEDNTCTADFKCAVCGKNQSVKCDITIDTKDAVCEAGGVITYKAVCTFDGKEYTDTKTEDIPALGHKYGKPKFEWTKDNTCTIVVRCENCKETVFTDNCQVNCVKTEASCEKAGAIVYTTSYTYEGKEYTDMKKVDIPAKGHDWSEWKVIKEASADSKGEREKVCKTCGQVKRESIAKLPVSGNGSNAGTSGTSQNSAGAVKTGDENRTTGAALGVSAALLGIVLALQKKKR